MKTTKSTFEGDYRIDGKCFKASVSFHFERKQDKGRIRESIYRVVMKVGSKQRTIMAAGSIRPCPGHATLLLDHWKKDKPIGRNNRVWNVRGPELHFEGEVHKLKVV